MIERGPDAAATAAQPTADAAPGTADARRSADLRATVRDLAHEAHRGAEVGT